MLYKIEIAHKVEKFLKKSPQRLIDKFGKQIEMLAENPYRNDLDVKKLTGFTDIYRLRIGIYRFLYRIKKDVLVIFVFDAGHRKNVYRKK